MVSERMRRRLDALLDEADAAATEAKGSNAASVFGTSSYARKGSSGCAPASTSFGSVANHLERTVA